MIFFSARRLIRPAPDFTLYRIMPSSNATSCDRVKAGIAQVRKEGRPHGRLLTGGKVRAADLITRPKGPRQKRDFTPAAAHQFPGLVLIAQHIASCSGSSHQSLGRYYKSQAPRAFLRIIVMSSLGQEVCAHAHRPKTGAAVNMITTGYSISTPRRVRESS
jgi:hypothetical protein